MGVGGQQPLTGGPKPAFSLSAVTVFHTNSTGCTLTAVISAVIVKASASTKHTHRFPCYKAARGLSVVLTWALVM